MYQITCDNQVIYDVRSKDRIVTSPKLVLEVGKNGTLSFRIPKTNPMYEHINLKKSIFRVYQVDNINGRKTYTRLFRGMAYSKADDFYSRGQIECEGELSFFNDSIVRKYEYTGSVENLFTKYVNEHNNKVDEPKRFTPRRCTVIDNNDYIRRANENFPTTKEEMDNKLIDMLGGHFETEEIDGVNYIDYIAEYDKYNTQPIVFKKNMLDFTKHISAEGLKTVIIPLGQKQEDGTCINIASVNNGKDYIEDESAINIFGRIEGTVKYDDVTVPSNLLNKGRKDLENSVNLNTTVEVTAADLHELDVNIEALRVGRMTRVISIPHKWDKYMLLSKLELNLDNIKSSKVTLGATYKTLTQKQLDEQKKINVISNSVQKIENINKEVSTIKDDVTTINTIIVEIPSEYAKTADFNTFKEQVNQKLGRVYTVKGSVANYVALSNLSSKQVGDVYNVLSSGANYVYTEDGWDKLSENFDLSAYLTIAEAENRFVTVVVLENYVTKDEYESLVARVEALENLNNIGGSE